MEHGGNVQSLEWSPDGHRLASLTHSGALKIWDTMDYSLCVTISGSGRFTGRPAWSPNGALIAIPTGPSPTGIALYSAASGELLRTLGSTVQDTPQDSIFSLSWSPNGSRLAAGSVTGRVQIWETAGWDIVYTIASPGRGTPDRPGGAVAYSPDGRTLACSDGTNVSLNDAATGKFLRNVTRECPIRILWSPDGGRLGFTGSRMVSYIVNLTTGQGSSNSSAATYGLRLIDESYALSLDFCWSAYPESSPARLVYPIRVSAQGWSGPAKYLVSHALTVVSLAWSPGRDRLASGDSGGTIKIWSHDTDRDMYADVVDRFPDERTQWNDTDRDGFGDNPKGKSPDAFPNDPREWKDTDGDGMGDNSDPLPTFHNVQFVVLAALVLIISTVVMMWLQRRKKRRIGEPGNR